MSMDRSLRSANALVRHRNVLTRAERLTRLKDEEKWTDGKGPFGLPKVANRKLEAAKPAKAEGEEATATTAAGAPAASGAAAGGKAAGNAGAKGAAAPSGGAKGTAPAAGKAAPAAKKK